MTEPSFANNHKKNSRSGQTPSTCALSGRRKRALKQKGINDEPIDGIHYRPNDEMTEEDKAIYIKSLKALKTSPNDSLVRIERELQVIMLVRLYC